MKMVLKTFYASVEEVNRLTSEAIGIMEPRTKIRVRIHRNGSTSIKTNSPAALELFETKLFDFDNLEDEND